LKTQTEATNKQISEKDLEIEKLSKALQDTNKHLMSLQVKYLMT